MKDIPLTVFLAVAAGGALGAVARFALSQLFAHKPGEFPVSTFIVNVLGSFIMGVGYVVIVQKMMLPPMWRQVTMIGFLGAMTTFSTFSLDAFLLWQSGHTIMSLSYVLLSIFLSLAAVTAAILLTEKLV